MMNMRHLLVVFGILVSGCWFNASSALETLEFPKSVGENDINFTNRREAKFLSLFTVVKFGNNQCTSSTNASGTCLTSAECGAEGGTSAGSCAAGFGVCCVFSYSACGSMTSRNCSYFTTPTLSASGQNCVYMINKCSSDICQMKVDFFTFNIAQPNKYVDPLMPTKVERATASNCIQDQFSILNGATSFAPICGLNSGQHMYVDVANSQFIKLRFLLSSTATPPNTASPTRIWSLKVTQIPCSSYTLLAPPGCLQYYTELSGTVTSFNYDQATPSNSFHLANQNYGICFRMETNYCSICYTVCDTTDANKANSFDISGQGTTADAAGSGTTSCLADYILIPGGFNQADNTMQGDRLCGQRFNSVDADAAHQTVCSTRKPFQFNFVTNTNEGDDAPPTKDEAPTGGWRGFCLKYTQSPCTGGGK